MKKLVINFNGNGFENYQDQVYKIFQEMKNIIEKCSNLKYISINDSDIGSEKISLKYQ